jgi:ribose transport system substrate-binding protein
VKHRRVAVAVALPVLLLAAACGGNDSDSAKSGDDGYKVTLIQGQRGEEFYVSMDCGAKAAAKELGVTLDTQGPDKFDATLQNPIIDSVVAKKPDAILIAPNDTVASVPPLKQADAAGIKTILVDTVVDDDSIGLSRISSDNVEGGRAAAKELATQIGDKGSVLFIGTTKGVSSVDARQKGFEEEIKKHSNIKYVGPQYSENDLQKANSIVTSSLAANPDLAGIFAANLTSADGAASGLKQTGKQATVKIVGFDAGPAQVKQLEAGDVQALIVQKPYDMGYQGVQFAVKALKGESVEKQVATDFVVAKKDNLSSPDISKFLYKSSC